MMMTATVVPVIVADVARTGGVDVVAPVSRQSMQPPAAEEGNPSLEEHNGDGEETLHRENGLQTTFNCNSNIPACPDETQVKESSRTERSSEATVGLSPQKLAADERAAASHFLIPPGVARDGRPRLRFPGQTGMSRRPRRGAGHAR